MHSTASVLDVDSCNGCSSSVAGSRVGVSSSVFRVMLSGSGLRTFAITAAPGFVQPATDRCRRCRRAQTACACGLLLSRCPLYRRYLAKTAFRPGNTRLEATHLRGSPRRNIWLEVGRSSLMESSCRSYVISLATPCFQRQCNGLAERDWSSRRYEKFIETWTKTCRTIERSLKWEFGGDFPGVGPGEPTPLYCLPATPQIVGAPGKFMDQLWTPWRFTYVTTADGAPRPGIPAQLDAWPGDTGCVFCNLVQAVDYAIGHGTPADEAEAGCRVGASRQVTATSA